MKPIHLIAAGWAMTMAIAAPATAQSPEEQRQIDWALERGRLLFALDRAAWVATDDMMERVPNPAAAGIIGYIVDRDEQGLLGIFFARDGGRLVAAYRGRISADGIASREVFAAGQRPELTARQQRLARALEHIREHVPRLRMCGARPNVAIVPPDTPDGPIEVYVMTPQVETTVIPFGGHHRLRLGADGRVLEQRAFTNSCLNMSTTPPKELEQVSALTISHLLDPVPTEIHVFSSMAARLPVYVLTTSNRHLWSIEGDRIRLVSNDIGASQPSGDGQ